MIFWLDAQLPPSLAKWLEETFQVTAKHVLNVTLPNLDDKTIFIEAKKQKVCIISKDIDFPLLQERLGCPPQIIWLRCGNCLNEHLKRLFSLHFKQISELLNNGREIIEISDSYII